MTLSWEQLQQQDSDLSNAICAAFTEAPEFLAEARQVTSEILARDAEDASKLQQGIDMAVDKGVIPAQVTVEETTAVDVLGKSVEEVCDVIINKLGDAAKSGCIMTLQGLSGTGKGTTVERLKQRLERVSTWSNGNIFRSLTLLAVTHTEQKQCSLEEALTPELLQEFCAMLKFGKFDGKFDVEINGLGINARVSEVCNTVLKQKKVSTVIPTVARVTQGEVIRFVQHALDQMVDDGMTVLLEGRSQTLDYIRTPHRFELVLSDEQLIGKRRVAQIIGADALQELKAGKGKATPDQSAINLALKQTLAKLQMQRAAALSNRPPNSPATKSESKKNHSNTVSVASGSVYKKVFNVSEKDHAKYGTELKWEFKSMDVGYDIDFTLYKDGKAVLPKTRCSEDRGTITIPPGEKGKVVFLWDNTFSWVNSKNIKYSVVVLLPHEVEARELEFERQRRAEELRKQEEERVALEAEAQKTAEEELRQEGLCLAIREECGKLAQEISRERKAWEDQRDLLEEKRRQTLREIAARFEDLQKELEKGIADKVRAVDGMIDGVESQVAQVTTEKDAMTYMLQGLRDQLTSDLSLSDLSMSDMSYGEEHESDGN